MGQTVMRDGPKMAIDHNLFFQMIRDPKFFTAVPVFYFMKDQAAAVVATIDKAVADKNCVSCVNMKDRLMPLMSGFVRMCKALKHDNPAELERLVTYIAGRRGFRPRPLVVYTREQGGTVAAIEF